MQTVSVSQKYQVVIPRELRVALGIRPGQKPQALRYGDRLELIPQHSIVGARGFLRGIDTAVEREDDRV
jgi:AbrB family looped-hinge helix DNA binding protein